MTVVFGVVKTFCAFASIAIGIMLLCCSVDFYKMEKFWFVFVGILALISGTMCVISMFV